ncbi:MAG: phosphoglycolate phosphatase [Pseudomonadota bacterium]
MGFKSKFDAVFFDLDGTLIDTAPDMANALNTLLKTEGHQPIAFERLRPLVSHGARGLLGEGFNIASEHPDYSRLRQSFLDIYEENLFVDTRLFEHIEKLLDQLETANVKWGIVTNKPGYLTTQLLDSLELSQRSATTISGDTLDKAKPHPEPLWEACKRVDVLPENCLYVGDAERDIIAGKAAGMKTATAMFGYIPADENPTSWNANWNLQSAQELLSIIFE